MSAGYGAPRMRMVWSVAVVLWVFLLAWLTPPGPGDYGWD